MVKSSLDFAKQNSADALSQRGNFKVEGAPKDSMLDTVDDKDCKLEHSHLIKQKKHAIQKKSEEKYEEEKSKEKTRSKIQFSSIRY